jgi:hypothetical protein
MTQNEDSLAKEKTGYPRCTEDDKIIECYLTILLWTISSATTLQSRAHITHEIDSTNEPIMNSILNNTP